METSANVHAAGLQDVFSCLALVHAGRVNGLSASARANLVSHTVHLAGWVQH